jgi:hypothetical protein
LLPACPGLARTPDQAVRPGHRNLKWSIIEMLTSTKSRAEEQYAATQKKNKQALKQKEEAQLVSDQKIARLRALRLAKEAEDRKVAEKEAAQKVAAKKKKKLTKAT